MADLETMTDGIATPKGNPALLSFWWACVEAGYQLENDEAHIPDAACILSFVEHGTTAMVFARDMRAAIALIDAATNAGKPQKEQA
jgi:hypothetical protein